MRRRLYYLLPDKIHAEQMSKDLKHIEIPVADIHAISKNQQALEFINDTHSMNETDRDYFIEWFLWRANLITFFLALAILVIMLLINTSYWLLLPISVMVLTFALGVIFAMKIPHVHFNEFSPALKHGEVLMMIDVPKSNVGVLSQILHKRHPEAVAGGVSWTL